MTAQPQEAAAPAGSAGVVVACEPCGLEFAAVTGPAEGQHLAGVHNGLHHAGHPAAAVTAPAQAAEAASSAGQLSAGAGGMVAAQRGWAVDPQVLADARSQAVPFTGDEQATGRAWAARVDTAVQGMDALDPAGVDVWAEAHAESAEPHLVEAELVSAWETWVRHEYAADAGADTHADASDAGQWAL